jgi:uncharacterized protein YcbK (DUF882 family)
MPVLPEDPLDESPDVVGPTSPLSLDDVSAVSVVLEPVLSLVDDIEAAEVGLVDDDVGVPVDPSVAPSVPALPSSPAGQPSRSMAMHTVQVSVRMRGHVRAKRILREIDGRYVGAVMLARMLALALLLAATSVPVETASKKELYLQSKSEREPTRAAVREAVTVLYARNLHTHEVMALEGPDVTPEAVDTFLRCWFTDEQRDIPDELVGRMRETAHRFGAKQVHIVSGFRHVKYNKLLRKKGREVALQSEHTTGSAIDFSLPGVDVAKVYKWLLAEHDGGVGFYKGSGFVHIDTGKKRTWKGT